MAKSGTHNQNVNPEPSTAVWREALFTMQVASELLARQLKVNRGTVVQAVPPSSAAAKSGLLPTRRSLSGIVAGDAIIAIDKRPVNKPGLTFSSILLRCHCNLNVHMLCASQPGFLTCCACLFIPAQP